jgi:hypothetical protein
METTGKMRANSRYMKAKKPSEPARNSQSQIVGRKMCHIDGT